MSRRLLAALLALAMATWAAQLAWPGAAVALSTANAPKGLLCTRSLPLENVPPRRPTSAARPANRSVRWTGFPSP